MDLYIINAPTAGRLKIGISTNAEHRLRQIQAHSPVPLTLAYRRQMTERDAYKCEKSIHLRLASFRTHGEWFDCSLESALATVERYGSRCPLPELAFPYLVAERE